MCDKKIEIWIERGYHGKEITVKCGSTSPSGYPYLCDACEKKDANVDWRREAALNGEAWGPEDY